MKKKMKRLSKGIMASVILTAMLLGAVAMVGGVLKSARADDSEYNFTAKELDTGFYAALYPDLAPIANDPLALFRHYAEHGIYEGRIPYAGAEPGAPVAGYTTVGINPDLAANATVVSQTDATGTTIVNNAPDLSEWTPTQLAAYAQKQIEFDASGLVHVSWSEQQVQDLLFSLKSVYPEGSYGGICSVGSGKIGAALYGADSDWFLVDEQGSVLCDKDGMRVMPVGYVRRETIRRANCGNIRDVRVGDMIDTNGSSGTGHVMIVLTHDEKGITVVESNWGGDQKFHWGRKISWKELESNSGQNKWTKYVHYLY